MATPAPATITATLDHVKVARLHESKMNPRRHFSGIEELTASVKQHGVLTPLLVRMLAAESGKLQEHLGYEIIAGARRYRAAKAAGIESLPVRVLYLDDAQALEFQVIENLQREDVHPLDEALGYQALLKAGKHDIASIAAKVNKSESYVYQRLKLAALIPEAQKAFLEDKLTAGHAILIARLQPQEQKQLLTGHRSDEMSVRNMAEYIEENFHLGQSSSYGSSRGISTLTVAQKAKQRKERAIGEARTEAVRQLANEIQWPLNEQRARVIATSFLSRTNFDGQKLLCKALGVWPKDGKTGGFDFRSSAISSPLLMRAKAQAHLAALDKNGLAGFLVAIATVPDLGRWGGGYEGNADEVRRLNQATAGTGISVKKLENQHIAAANAKAAKKQKPAKVQTSAKKNQAKS